MNTTPNGGGGSTWVRVILALLLALLCLAALAAWWLLREDSGPRLARAEGSEARIELRGDQWVLHDPQLPSPFAIDPLDWANQWGSPAFFDVGSADRSDRPKSPPSGAGGLEHLGLRLVWPSLHMPAGTTICTNAASPGSAKSIAQLCPAMSVVLTARLNEQIGDNLAVLRDDGRRIRQRWLRRKEVRLESDQQQLPFETRRVTQWSAFYTTAGDDDDANGNGGFLGWQCDRDALASKNERVGAWGPEKDLWAVPPAAMEGQPCHRPTQWDLLRPLRFGGVRQHVVLWNCPQPIETLPASWSTSDQSCHASFIWGNHLIDLSFESEPAIRDRGPTSRSNPSSSNASPSNPSPSYASPASAYSAPLSPRMVQAAWRALQQGLHGQATPAAPAAARCTGCSTGSRRCPRSPSHPRPRYRQRY